MTIGHFKAAIFERLSNRSGTSTGASGPTSERPMSTSDVYGEMRIRRRGGRRDAISTATPEPSDRPTKIGGGASTLAPRNALSAASPSRQSPASEGRSGSPE